MPRSDRWRPRHPFVLPVVVFLTAFGIVSATTVGPSPASPAVHAAPSGRIYFGIDGAAGKTAASGMLARHTYGHLSGSVPRGRMITMGTGGRHWNQIASARSGSTTYRNIVRWADTLKARGGTVLLSFSHEPEAAAKSRFGPAAEYVRAYRHVVQIFRSRGVHNVEWTWQMTGFAFRVGRHDSRYALRWYPGDAFVNDVAGDVYNWASCRGRGRWTELSTVAAPMLAFARAHHKKAVLAEYASDSGPRRAQWLRNVHRYLVANARTYRGAFYFDHPNHTACTWALTSQADVGAFMAIARDRHFTH